MLEDRLGPQKLREPEREAVDQRNELHTELKWKCLRRMTVIESEREMNVWRATERSVYKKRPREDYFKSDRGARLRTGGQICWSKRKRRKSAFRLWKQRILCICEGRN